MEREKEVASEEEAQDAEHLVTAEGEESEGGGGESGDRKPATRPRKANTTRKK